MDTCKKDLERMVGNIVAGIEAGITNRDAGVDCESEGLSPDDQVGGYDYLADALDIQYIVSGAREYLGARVLVAFGGPNIWINTHSKQVEGYWWGDTVIRSYHDDKIGLDEALSEIWGCS